MWLIVIYRMIMSTVSTCLSSTFKLWQVRQCASPLCTCCKLLLIACCVVFRTLL